MDHSERHRLAQTSISREATPVAIPRDPRLYPQISQIPQIENDKVLGKQGFPTICLGLKSASSVKSVDELLG
jgi:hypothetical protein